MNWYKRASWAIQLHEQFYEQAKIFAQKIIEIFKEIRRDYMKSRKLQQSSTFVGTIKFPDVKTGKIFNFEIYVNNVFATAESGGYFIIGTNKIYINVPLDMVSRMASDEIIENKTHYIESILWHEITHGADPKPDDIKRKMNPEDVSNKLRPIEFDSYSRQIIDEIKNAYNSGNDEDKKNILLWMKNFYKLSKHRIPTNIKKSLKLTDFLFDVLGAWRTDDDARRRDGRVERKWMERFLTRLYNEIKNMEMKNENNSK